MEDKPEPPKKIAFVSCEKQTFKINIGDGEQTCKWLALSIANKITNQRKGGGRITSRSPHVDGRLNTVPVPECVSVGRHRKWVHPTTKLNEIHARYGGTAIIHVDLEYRPSLSQGVHERSVWGDVAFGGERGEERYQAWLLDQRSKGINIGDEDEEDEDEESAAQKSTSSLSSKEDEETKRRDELKHEYDVMWRRVTLKNYGAEMEKQKCAEYVFKHYVDIRDFFSSLTEFSRGNSSEGTLSLAELTHFVWQHDLDQCCSGLRRSTGGSSSSSSGGGEKNGVENKAMLAKLEEEQIIRETAFLVCFDEEKKDKNENDDDNEEEEETKTLSLREKKKKSGGSSGGGGGARKNMKMTLPQFIEFLIRYAAYKREKSTSGGTKKKKDSSSNYANAHALRQMLQRLEAPLNRRRNESIRKLMRTKIIVRNVEPFFV